MSQPTYNRTVCQYCKAYRIYATERTASGIVHTCTKCKRNPFRGQPDAPAAAVPLEKLSEDTLDIFASPKQAPAQPTRTSEDAAARVSPTLSQKRRDLLLWMLRNAMEGATDNELLAALRPPEWSPNGIRNRRIELYRGGWLEQEGERDGCMVWRPSAKAMHWFETHLRSEAA